MKMFAGVIAIALFTVAETPTVTGTWNMGLQGDHVIPTALVLNQQGKSVSGTIALPTQHIGQRIDVELSGDFVDGALTLSGTVEGAAEPTTIAITGTLKDDGSLEGRVSMRDHNVPYTAERLKERKEASAVFVRRTSLSRRAVLRGLGATVALPFLDTMMPAGATEAGERLAPLRLICIEIVHGAAGSSAIGARKNLWSPLATGRDFDLTPTSLRSLEPFRDHLTIVSNTDVDPAEPFTAPEIGGDHFRSSAVFLTQAHPKQTAGGDVRAGISLDQLYAQRFGQETPLPSMQLCIEPVDQAGGCGYGYSCVYTDAISWASPTRPLPMIRDPRVVFDRLFGVFKSGLPAEERRVRNAEDRSILDWVMASASRLRAQLGPGDRRRLADYFDNVREVERRIRNVETFNASGEVRELPEAPIGVPDSFTEHVKLMCDLQVLAFASDVTRVCAFKLGRDTSNRVYPESGSNGPFHAASHHSGREERIVEFARINAYHVSLVAYLLNRLQSTPDRAAGTLLDHTVVLYGSPMGDPNQHNHKRVPFFVAGRAGGALTGGLHHKAANGTPLANAMLGVLRALGLSDLERFGDSDGVFDLNAVPAGV